jgi:hypothetical protein
VSADRKGTDPEWENQAGRMALWLTPEEIEWLADRCICGRNARLQLAEQVPREVLKGTEALRQPGGEVHTSECRSIRWHADQALHKAGLR